MLKLTEPQWEEVLLAMTKRIAELEGRLAYWESVKSGTVEAREIRQLLAVNREARDELIRFHRGL